MRPHREPQLREERQIAMIRIVEENSEVEEPKTYKSFLEGVGRAKIQWNSPRMDNKKTTVIIRKHDKQIEVRKNLEEEDKNIITSDKSIAENETIDEDEIAAESEIIAKNKQVEEKEIPVGVVAENKTEAVCRIAVMTIAAVGKSEKKKKLLVRYSQSEMKSTRNELKTILNILDGKVDCKDIDAKIYGIEVKAVISREIKMNIITRQQLIEASGKLSPNEIEGTICREKVVIFKLDVREVAYKVRAYVIEHGKSLIIIGKELSEVILKTILVEKLNLKNKTINKRNTIQSWNNNSDLVEIECKNIEENLNSRVEIKKNERKLKIEQNLKNEQEKVLTSKEEANENLNNDFRTNNKIGIEEAKLQENNKDSKNILLQGERNNDSDDEKTIKVSRQTKISELIGGEQLLVSEVREGIKLDDKGIKERTREQEKSDRAKTIIESNKDANSKVEEEEEVERVISKEACERISSDECDENNSERKTKIGKLVRNSKVKIEKNRNRKEKKEKIGSHEIDKDSTSEVSKNNSIVRKRSKENRRRRIQNRFKAEPRGEVKMCSREEMNEALRRRESAVKREKELREQMRKRIQLLTKIKDDTEQIEMRNKVMEQLLEETKGLNEKMSEDNEDYDDYLKELDEMTILGKPSVLERSV